MKQMKRILSLFLSCLLLLSLGAGCAEVPEETAPESETILLSETVPAETAPAETLPAAPVKTEQALREIAALGQPADDLYRTWYEIFVYTFCDSDGDGIGDFRGILSKLDDLEELGITGIWLMPIHPSTTYHKYNVTDYYQVDPDYGTMEDFEELMAECDRRGIKVILDLVLNHTGSAHAWFREATDYLKTLPVGEEPDAEACPYTEYYNFLPADSCPGGYTAVNGAPGWYYESRFSPDMPDLNLGNEAVREEIRKIMAFWLEKGAAGFRLDAAKEYYSGETDRNLEVLSWITETARELKPDCFLVAEVWDSFAQVAKFYKSGIPAIFDYPFGSSNGKIVKVLRGAGNPSVVSTYATAQAKADSTYRQNNPDYIDAPFLSNHDVGRIAGFVGRDPAKTKLAGAMNLFMTGSAFIYYGEEIGMVCGAANDPSYRAPMYWNAERDSGTTVPPPGCVLPDYPMGSLEDQKNDDDSVYNYYRQAIAVRNALPVISHGIPEAEAALNKGCISACRKTWNGESCIILMNIDPEAAEADLTGYEDWILAAGLSADGNSVALEGTQLHLPAFGTAVLLPKN